MSAPKHREAMGPDPEVFRGMLLVAATAAVEEHADTIASDVVAAIYNTVDDERGRLREDNQRLRQSRENGERIVAARDAEILRLRDERKRLADVVRSFIPRDTATSDEDDAVAYALTLAADAVERGRR